MLIFKKQKEEVKNEIKEEISSLCENGKLIAVGLVAFSALAVGFISGSVSTAIVYNSVQRRQY